MTFSALTARVVITPERSYPLGGFAARSEPSMGRHLSLEANVVVLATESSAFAWVAIDVLAITSTLRDAITQTVRSAVPIPLEAVLIVASHTHSAPFVWHGAIHPVLPAVVDEEECRRIANAIGQTLRGAPLQGVTVRKGSTTVEGVSGNRHRLDGPVDRSLLALAISTESAPVAVVFDFACHATGVPRRRSE